MLGLKSKIIKLPKLLVARGNATILLILTISTLVVWLTHRRATSHRRAWSILSIALTALLCGALILSLRVGPYAMYYASVAAVAVLLTARALAAARLRAPGWAIMALLAASLIPAWTPLVIYKNILLKSVDLDRWTGVQTHRSALQVAQAIA